MGNGLKGMVNKLLKGTGKGRDRDDFVWVAEESGVAAQVV